MTKHRADSLIGRIAHYFDTNPEEELTLDDVVAKFGVARQTAIVAVHRLSTRGELESVHIIRRRSKTAIRVVPAPPPPPRIVVEFDNGMRRLIWLECADAPRTVDEFVPRYDRVAVVDVMFAMALEGLLIASRVGHEWHYSANVPARKKQPSRGADLPRQPEEAMT